MQHDIQALLTQSENEETILLRSGRLLFGVPTIRFFFVLSPSSSLRFIRRRRHRRCKRRNCSWGSSRDCSRNSGWTQRAPRPRCGRRDELLLRLCHAHLTPHTSAFAEGQRAACSSDLHPAPPAPRPNSWHRSRGLRAAAAARRCRAPWRAGHAQKKLDWLALQLKTDTWVRTHVLTRYVRTHDLLWYFR